MKNTERKALVKLKPGNDKLMIKIGRHDQIPREQSIYPTCMSTNIEDEIHSLQCRSQTSEQDEASFERRGREPLEGSGGQTSR